MLHLSQIILSCVSLTMTCVIDDLVENNFKKVALGSRTKAFGVSFAEFEKIELDKKRKENKNCYS
jgi:hypothetical protein